MLLKDVLVRRGIAFLEPKCVVMKGHQTEDRELLQAADFARGLRLRLGSETSFVWSALYSRLISSYFG